MLRPATAVTSMHALTRPAAVGAAPLRPGRGAASTDERSGSGAAASTSGSVVPLAGTKAPVYKRAEVSWFDALKFNGPAPELINGRLAMVGMLLVANGEASTGQTALQLLQGGAPWQYAAVALWVYASMVPILKGARHEAFGMFTPRAEYTNGRAAMLGWAILLALERQAGVPFF